MAIKSSDQISLVDLTDGFSVILTNDSYTFPGTTNAAKAGSTTTTIVAMCGADQIPAAVDNSKIIAPTGVTTSVDTDATQPTVTISVTTAVKTGGTVDIPVSLDGGNIIIHKYFTFQIAFTGATGAAGSSAQWYSGIKITGTSTTATIFSDSGITAAKEPQVKQAQARSGTQVRKSPVPLQPRPSFLAPALQMLRSVICTSTPAPTIHTGVRSPVLPLLRNGCM